MQFIIDQHLFDKFTILWFLSFVFFNWIATLKAKTTYCEKASHSIGNLRIFNHEFTSLAIIRLSSYTAWFVKRRGLELRTSGPRYSSTVQLLLTQCLTVYYFSPNDSLSKGCQFFNSYYPTYVSFSYNSMLSRKFPVVLTMVKKFDQIDLIALEF